MSESSQHTHQRRPCDVSRQALSIARAVDRICRDPGRYTITIDVPSHRNNAWRVRVARVDLLRDMRTRRRR
ncbi:MAG TPA: hypothetical protein VK879_14945 [Candidatus Sulfomarinibacteraceae bacterium]|nr:hypothetical protein [Candidatus Sulfomarinibacteraceae bacterium]